MRWEAVTFGPASPMVWSSAQVTHPLGYDRAHIPAGYQPSTAGFVMLGGGDMSRPTPTNLLELRARA